MTKPSVSGDKLARFLQPPTQREREMLTEAVPGSMRQAYVAGSDAYERGEPAAPPATIPARRKTAWLKGWSDRKRADPK